MKKKQHFNDISNNLKDKKFDLQMRKCKDVTRVLNSDAFPREGILWLRERHYSIPGEDCTF